MSSFTLPRFSSANVSVVTDRILVGGDLDMYDDELAARPVNEIEGQGVTHIVDCRFEAADDDIWADIPQVNYLHHGMDDGGQTVPGEWFDVGVAFLHEALADPDALVLTHCHMGVNRGPSLGFALLLEQGWDPVDAMDAIREARPIAYISYAEDALRWHHQRTGASIAEQIDQRSRMAKWRRADSLDVRDVIRKIRDGEGR